MWYKKSKSLWSTALILSSQFHSEIVTVWHLVVLLFCYFRWFLVAGSSGEPLYFIHNRNSRAEGLYVKLSTKHTEVESTVTMDKPLLFITLWLNFWHICTLWKNIIKKNSESVSPLWVLSHHPKQLSLAPHLKHKSASELLLKTEEKIPKVLKASPKRDLLYSSTMSYNKTQVFKFFLIDFHLLLKACKKKKERNIWAVFLQKPGVS